MCSNQALLQNFAILQDQILMWRIFFSKFCIDFLSIFRIHFGKYVLVLLKIFFEYIPKFYQHQIWRKIKWKNLILWNTECEMKLEIQRKCNVSVHISNTHTHINTHMCGVYSIHLYAHVMNVASLWNAQLLVYHMVCAQRRVLCKKTHTILICEMYNFVQHLILLKIKQTQIQESESFITFICNEFMLHICVQRDFNTHELCILIPKYKPIIHNQRNLFEMKLYEI